jgi:hypothetical protein
MWEVPKLKKLLVVQIEQSMFSMDYMTQACLHRESVTQIHLYTKETTDHKLMQVAE